MRKEGEERGRGGRRRERGFLKVFQVHNRVKLGAFHRQKLTVFNCCCLDDHAHDTTKNKKSPNASIFLEVWVLLPIDDLS